MKNPRILILAIGFFVVAIGGFGTGLRWSHPDLQTRDASASKSQTSAVQKYISALTGENLKDREKAAEAIRKEHAELIKQLIELAGKEAERSHPEDVESSYLWHDSKHLAMLLLGDLHAVEAVSVLLENLEYKNPNSIYVYEPLDKGGWYPAAAALSKIGMPAVGPTIEKLGSYAPKSKGSELCCWVVKKILGIKLARLRVQIAIEEARDTNVKQNLAAALPYFKTEQEKAGEERARRKKAGG